MRTRLILGTAMLVLPLSACSFSASFGTKQVAAGKLEAQVSEALAAEYGEVPDEIDCPDPLDAEVGATARCVLTEDNVSYGVTVTVTRIDGTSVKFDAEVDSTPTKDA